MIRLVQRKWKMFGAIIAFVLVCGLIASWAVGGSLCAACNHPVVAPTDLAVESVIFPSKSGATIHGWLLGTETNRAVVILQHGIHGSRAELVTRARFLTEAGYAVLMFDFQGHGESIGSRITFGYLESRDSQAAVAFAKARFPGKPVGVIGLSLGAAAASLAEPPLDVQALVLEMMYPTVVEATKDRIAMRFGPPGRLLSPLLTAQLKWRIGCTTDDLRPVVSVASITVPKLFIAGTEDRDTTLVESKEIFARAAEPKAFVTFEGARHEDLLTLAPERYKKTILDFLETHLK
jgi:alpha-beta hydrolase superfamily lysophospholipase